MPLCLLALPFLLSYHLSAATFSAQKYHDELNLLQLRIQSASVDENTWTKYTATCQQFLNWAEHCCYEPDGQAAVHWCIHLATEKKLSPDTIDQYLSHLQSFTELGLLPQIRTMASKRLIKGLRKLFQKTANHNILLPSTVLILYQLLQPTLIQSAILFQAFTGLRGG